MGKRKLFTGLYQYNSYMEVINEIIKEHEDGRVENLGLNSVWKGAATFLCSESTVGPSIVVIRLRAWWEIIGVKERCLKFDASGDQYYSSKVTEKSAMTVNFAIFPLF